MRAVRILRLCGRASAITAFAVGPVACIVAIAWFAATGSSHPIDFTAFWNAGGAVVHGRSPYPQLASLPHVADRLTFAPFVYPAPAAVAVAPLSAVPLHAAFVVWLLLSVAAIVVALRLLGVSDWRCYGATFVSAPVLAGLGSGAFSALLALGVAIAWRYRDRAVVAGAAVAAVVVAKLFLWPLGLWLVVTRRYRAAAVAIGGAALSTFGAWALIGFGGLHDYPALLSRLTKLVGPSSYSLYALARSAGAGAAVAQYVPFVLAAALVVAVRRRAEAAVLVAALAGALAATPILWPHYLVLLVVPLAFASTRFSWVWVVPGLLWLDDRPWSYARASRIVPELAVVAVVFAAAYAASTARTSSAWVSGFTFRMTRLTLPSWAITNVERSTPM